jgi:hypothetical protein
MIPEAYTPPVEEPKSLEAEFDADYELVAHFVSANEAILALDGLEPDTVQILEALFTNPDFDNQNLIATIDMLAKEMQVSAINFLTDLEEGEFSVHGAAKILELLNKLQSGSDFDQLLGLNIPLLNSTISTKLNSQVADILRASQASADEFVDLLSGVTS